MEDHDVRATLRQRLLDEFLAAGAACPRPLVLRRVPQREYHPAQTRMML